MAVEERRRHALSKKLEQVLGLEDAVTLMENFPAVTWADVATKDYVDLRLQATEQSLRAAFKEEIGGLRAEITSEITNQFTKQTQTMVVSLIGLVITMILALVGVIFSMAQVLGS